MTCNCGGNNEYDITVNNNGDCEPSTPIYNISLGNVGINGYSPIVNFVNQTDESFNLQVENITGVTTSGAIPLYSWVSGELDDINYALEHIDLSSRLTTNGSNATYPFSVGNLTLYSDSTTISGSINASGYISTGEIRPRNSSGITIGYSGYDAPINLVTANKVNYNGSEIATLSDIPTITDRLKTDGSNADNDFTVNGVELAGNYVYMNSVSYGGVSVTQSNSDIYAKLEVDSSKGYLKLPGLNINSGASGNIACNTIRDIVLNGSNTSYKMYYHGTSANDEIATLGDITGTSYVAGDNITISGDTISATDTTYSNFVGATTLTGGSAGLVPAPTTSDAGKFLRGNGTWSEISGASITPPLVLMTDALDMIALGFRTNTSPHSVYMGVQNSQTGYQALKLIYDSSNPISLTDDPSGHGTSKIELNYNTNTMGLDSSNKLTVKEMTGCDSVTGGTSGLVPTPSAGDEDKFLKGDGTWDTVGGGVSEIFIAEYGTTTYQEVLDAYNASKVVFCYDDDNNTYAPITNYTGTEFYFSTGLIIGTSASYVLDNSDSWDSDTTTLATVAITGSYNNLSNKPTIPTVYNSTITFTQGGVTKGTITLNQSSDATIALDAGGSTITVDQTYDGTSANPQSGVAIQGELTTNYQGKLTAGSNIQINGTTISATNTTYSAMTVSEGTTGTATTARTMRADRLKSIIQGTKLTGLSTATNSAVTATDDILTGIGKLQAEINGIDISGLIARIQALENGIDGGNA